MSDETLAAIKARERATRDGARAARREDREVEKEARETFRDAAAKAQETPDAPKSQGTASK